MSASPSGGQGNSSLTQAQLPASETEACKTQRRSVLLRIAGSCGPTVRSCKFADANAFFLIETPGFPGSLSLHASQESSFGQPGTNIPTQIEELQYPCQYPSHPPSDVRAGGRRAPLHRGATPDPPSLGSRSSPWRTRGLP